MKSSRKRAEPEWTWSPEHGRYYKYYLDVNGEPQYEWAPEQTAAPRTDTTEQLVDAAAASLGQLQVDDDYGSPGYTFATPHTGVAGGYQAGASEEVPANEDGEEEEYDYSQPQTTEAAAGTSSKGKGKGKAKSHDKKSSKSKKEGKSSDKKGKGKAKDTHQQNLDAPSEPFFERPSQPQQQQQQHPRASRQTRGHGHHAAPTGGTGGTSDGSSNDPQPVDSGYGYQHHGRPAAGYAAGQPSPMIGYGGEADPQNQLEIPDQTSDPGVVNEAGYGGGFASEQQADIPDEEDPQLLQAMNASRQSYAMGSAGYQQPYDPAYAQAEASSYAQEVPDYEPVNDDDDDGQLTPTKDRPQLEPDMVITGTQGTYEQIDQRYRVEQSYKFQPGEVFKVLWSEPLGSRRDKTPSRVDLDTYTENVRLENEFGERFYVGFRRFIVVANDEGHCTCVPILTYIRQGCNKRGVKPLKHGIIHEYGTKARLLPDEPTLGFRPVRLEIKAAGEKLSRESRVNYSKLVTVEHNVKVFFIGNINAEDFDDTVPQAVDRCWQEKIHKRVKRQLHNVKGAR